ncbi:MAG: ribosome small subunit-dependent GTPase A [Firmicutes bacterium]|nr:ribosome small subunit-dependent GTPase A [Bacillota bacterium]
MIKGVVFKALGGYYFVRTGKDEYRCYLRGTLRKKGQVFVGDKVAFLPQEEHTGVIEKIEPRETQLMRPPVVNVNQAVIIFSLTQPKPNLFLLDRFLLQAEVAGLRTLICFNKIDLVESSNVPQIYETVGYPLIITSTKTGQGINELSSALKDNISVLAGPSGVGKSSLLNAVQPGLSLKTGEISTKLKAGKHTTRHVELLRLDNGGLVADTPGFSNLYLPEEIKGTDLVYYFPDFNDLSLNCRFSGCLHNREPGCAVKEGVLDGRIIASRYEHYIILLNEVTKRERRY